MPSIRAALAHNSSSSPVWPPRSSSQSAPTQNVTSPPARPTPTHASFQLFLKVVAGIPVASLACGSNCQSLTHPGTAPLPTASHHTVSVTASPAGVYPKRVVGGSGRVAEKGGSGERAGSGRQRQGGGASEVESACVRLLVPRYASPFTWGLAGCCFSYPFISAVPTYYVPTYPTYSPTYCPVRSSLTFSPAGSERAVVSAL